MEKVQFQLEATLPELKDLHEKGLFTKDEIDQITRRRTHLETSLIRQGVRKEDFFKYAEYEISLEKLRKVRWKRLGYVQNPPPPGASLFSIPRRTMYILKRATAKFPGDIATWLAYVEYAGREGMRKVVTKGLTSALQHHPLSSTLYLLSSFHHVHPGAPFPRSAIPSTSTLDLPSAAADDDDEEESSRGVFALEGTQPARTTLLLGLRMLPSNHDLWREYVKLELGWVEALRRRWKVLGINTPGPSATGEVGGEGSFGPDGEDARKAILGGQLVLQAIRSALAAIPVPQGTTSTAGLDFRETLLFTLRTYPSPLRLMCLDIVYGDLEAEAQAGGRQGARARLLLLSKGLYDRPYESGRKDDGGVALRGVELVEALGGIGKEIRKAVKSAGAEFGEVAGVWLDQQIKQNRENADLSAYLLSILASLAKPSLHPTPTLILLYLTHVESTSSPSEYHDLVQKYASLHPLDARLQLAHLQSSISTSTPTAIRSLADKLIKSFDQHLLSSNDILILRRLWTVWAEWEMSASKSRTDMQATWSKLLRLSLGSKGTPEIHDELLVLYLDWLIADESTTVMSALKRITGTYRPASVLFSAALARLVNGQAEVESKDVMRLHEAWRAVCKKDEERIEEGLAIAGVLLRMRKAAEAVQVVEVVKSELRERAGALGRLEGRWNDMMESLEEEGEESDDEEGDEDGSSEEGEGEADTLKVSI